MEEIPPAYVSSKETVTAIIMLYRNTKSMVRLADSNTGFHKIVSVVLQRDTLAPFLFHNLLSLCSMNVNRSNERKWFIYCYSVKS